MSKIEDAIGQLEEELSEAKKDVAAIARCLSILRPMSKEQQSETPPGNSHEDEPPEPVHQVKSNFVGVYPMGQKSKKWYASVTERGRTKRLCGTYDTPEEANAARSDYLAKRDDETAGSDSGLGPKHILSPSNDAAV